MPSPGRLLVVRLSSLMCILLPIPMVSLDISSTRKTHANSAVEPYADVSYRSRPTTHYCNCCFSGLTTSSPMMIFHFPSRPVMVRKSKQVCSTPSVVYRLADTRHISSVPESYARRVCNDIAKLGEIACLFIHCRKQGKAKRFIGARGASVMFSSGDYGVGDGNPDPATQICLTNDGRNITRFMPTFPARYVAPLTLHLNLG